MKKQITRKNYLLVYKSIYITQEGRKKTFTNRMTLTALDRYEAIRMFADRVIGEVIECRRVAIPTRRKNK